MEDIKILARAAKQRLKTNFWEDCKRNLDEGAELARREGLNEATVKSGIRGKVKKEIKGVRDDGFYLKVKAILDAEGEVSDAIGRLTDKELYENLSYEEKQRYNLSLSAKYLQALERYRREKRSGM